MPCLFSYVFVTSPSLYANPSVIIPDGTTSTQITGDPGSRLTITPSASNRDGTSMNSYERFDVGRAGVDFDNAQVQARLLVNQVTGALPSRIEGEIAILGPRAHFILANPNGIMVNGGSFVNTGAVALAAGTAELKPFYITPDRIQHNVILRSSHGSIEIGEGGLSGAMTRLELLSKSLRINGPVNNQYDNLNATLRATAGGGQLEIDSMVSPMDEATTWARLTEEKGSSDGILVDITPLGSLRAGRIEILVTDKGAGVRHAGDIHASYGDFILTAQGQISLEGGVIESGRHTLLAINELDMTPGINNKAPGINAKAGQLLIQIPGNISVQGGQVAGGAGVEIESAGLQMHSVTGTDGQILPASLISNGGSIVLKSTGDVGFAGADILARGDIKLTSGGNITSGPGAGSGSRIIAFAGALEMLAAGDISNHAGLLQGHIPDDEAPEAEEPDTEADADNPRQDSKPAKAVSLTAGGNISNRSLSADQLAIIFSQSGDIALEAGGDITNHTGRIIANGQLDLQAKGNFYNLIEKTGGANDEQVHSSGSSKQVLGLSFGKTSRTQDFGSLNIPGQLAYLIADGDLDIHATNVFNIGGSVSANNGSLTIKATERIESRALRTGSIQYKRNCFIRCRPKAISSVAITGGTLHASADVLLNAGQDILNIGGNIAAAENLTLEAPLSRAEAIAGYLALSQSRGLGAMMGRGYGELLRNDTGGVFAAGQNLTIAGDIIADGGQLGAEGELRIEGEYTLLREPVREKMGSTHKNGIFSSWLKH